MRKGISLVALIITIIVLIILTAAVVMTGVNTPQNAQLAVFKNNVATVQEAVTLKILNNLTESAVNGKNAETYKWVGVAEGYTYDATTGPTFTVGINGISAVKLSDAIKENINISDTEFDKYYIDSNGVIYYYDISTQKGFEYNGEIYYNATTKVAEGEEVELESIEITTVSNKTTYIEGDIFNTEGMVVTARYIDETSEIINSYTVSPSIALTIEDTEVTITYGGKTVTQAIIVNVNTTGFNSSGTTLGEIIRDAKGYGANVSGYTVNGISEWKIFYEDKTNGYVFMISTNNLGNTTLSTANSDVAIANMSSVYSIFKLGQSGYTLNSSYANSLAVANLVNNYGIYASPTEWTNSEKEYIVGAIGGPTIELFVAAYQEKVGTNIPFGISTYGYNIDGSYFKSIQNDQFYCNSAYYYWLASPSVYCSGSVFLSGCAAVACSVSCDVSYGLRPVVCLQSNIPASISEGVITLNP